MASLWIDNITTSPIISSILASGITRSCLIPERVGTAAFKFPFWVGGSDDTAYGLRDVANQTGMEGGLGNLYYRARMRKSSGH